MLVEQMALTFDDVLLLPAKSQILPKQARLSTNLTPKVTLNIPLMSAAMDTVTEAPLAIAIAQEGGIGIIHKNMSIAAQAKQVREVKKHESGIVNEPVTVSPSTTVGQLLELVAEYRISGMPVVEGEQLLGIVTKRDFRFETDVSKNVSEIMTPKEHLVTVKEGASKEQILAALSQHRLEKLLIVNGNFNLCGMITVKDLEKAKDKPFACKDSKGRLRVGAAIGTGDDSKERAAALVEVGVDVIVVDTAHGHSQKVLDMVAWVKQNYPEVNVIGGNIATKEAALDLAEAGADAVKVGIGPGSICTTRVVTGVGVPQITAIHEVATALKGRNISIIADGGVRYSGDIAKAIAAGAHVVMMGSMFAGTEEAPGEVELYQGRSYKAYRGMGSIGAMTQGSSDRYFQDSAAGAEKLVPEGIEARVPYKGSMVQMVQQMMGGLRSSMGYTGCESIEQLRTKAKFVQISNAGVRESHVHDVTITKEAPNYWTNE